MKIVKEYGFELNLQSVILDFGCGSGRYVQELREHGYQAFGCDINMKTEENVDTDSMIKNNIIRKIDLKNYILPFEDKTFDLIISDQVFEHVRNYSETIFEISRVLKPEGFCLHIFPSRYIPLEPHVFVPFSSIIQSYWWVHFWVLLGVRNEWQDCNTSKERSIKYYNYLKENTNYLSKKQLEKEFKVHFKNVFFCEKTFLKFSKRGKYIFAVSKVFPYISSMYSTFYSRVIMNRFPIESLDSYNASKGITA
ncbi:MAG: class I SAM-dependent methyltransferase [Bacteroidales bacterium]